MQKQRKRMLFIFIWIIIAMVALVVRLFYIQVITGEELAKKAERQQVKSIVVPAKRGDILD
jgi:cell division protein FtsI/penicillin-binding protein 2